VRLAQALDVLPIDLLAKDSIQTTSVELLQYTLCNAGTALLFHPISKSNTAPEKIINICLDPERLKEVRLRKKWLQRDLAQASGYCEDYISQLERATTTRNKGTKLETILRLAKALETAPIELLPEKLVFSLHTDITSTQSQMN
jgi:DNA-binding Xre family transcriptional regulator